MSANPADLADLTVPGPITTALTEPFWAGVREGELRVQRCRRCDRGVFYPRRLCPFCWSLDLDWERAGGGGRLATFSEVVRPGHPGWQGVSPYLVGIVELDEGPRLLAHLLADPSSTTEVGDRVAFEAIDIGGRILPVFRVAGRKRKETP